MKTHTIIILPDGETWNTLNGCQIVVITDEHFKDLCNDQINACNVQPIATIAVYTEDK